MDLEGPLSSEAVDIKASPIDSAIDIESSPIDEGIDVSEPQEKEATESKPNSSNAIINEPGVPLSVLA